MENSSKTKTSKDGKKIFTPAEVATHSTIDDCWVILNGKVLDLTPWMDKILRICPCLKKCTCTFHAEGFPCDDKCIEKCICFKRGFKYCDAKRLGQSILAHAGKDISSWFKDDDWVRYIHPIVTSDTPFYPHGDGIFQPVVPSTRWRPLDKPWWLDPEYVKGKATAKTRPIRIINTLTSLSVTLEVCSEETIYQIMLRYLPHNAHLLSYTWRYLGRNLCLRKTLEDNGIPDDRERFGEVGLPENSYIPAILIYYNDDLTEDPPNTDCFCNDLDCALNQPENCWAGKQIEEPKSDLTLV